MKREDITIIAQLLTAIKESVGRLEKAQKKKNAEELAEAKREVLGFQRQLEELLNAN